ncbi:MAG: hypothetical protein IJS12_10595 [Lachnospiraceae bacterium]|nr:hypothetical protein [Lachnospiraceae bacterium]
MVNKAKDFRVVLNQIFYIWCLWFVFVTEVGIHRIKTNGSVPPEFLLTLCISVILAVIYIVTGSYREFKITNIDYLSVILFTLVFLVRIPLFRHLQRWDGEEYYARIISIAEQLDFSSRFFFERFSIAGHTTAIYIFFMLLGEFLWPGSSIGVNIVTALMTACACVCLYGIIMELIPEADKKKAFGVVLLVQFVPIFWGTCSYINPDYMYPIFFIYMWYSHLKKKYVLTFFWMMAMIFTKETAWMIVFGYFSAYLVCELICGDGDSMKKRFISVIKNPIIPVLIAGMMSLALYYRFRGAVEAWGSTGGYVDGMFATRDQIEMFGQHVNAFGIYPEYIICKLNHYYVLNFNWIALAGIVFLLVCRILTRSVNFSLIKLLMPFIGAMIVFELFGLFYITYALPRYNVFSSISLWILFGILLIDSDMAYQVFYSITVFSGLLLIIQTFYYIDPLSNRLFVNLDTGRGPMLSVTMDHFYYADPVVNNFRYAYLDDLFDELLIEVNYDSDMQIVEWNPQYDQSCIAGYAGIYDSANFPPLGWDPVKKSRVTVLANEPGDGNSLINTVLVYDHEEVECCTADRLLLYFLPYNDMDEVEYVNLFQDNYSVEKSGSVSNWGGYLNYYVLKRR